MTATDVKGRTLFQKDKRTAYESIAFAQFIAFAPYIFQASLLLRDKGILKMLEDNREKGLTLQEIVPLSGLSHYATRVLAEAGLGIGLMIRNEDRYFITKTGYFFLSDPMTNINTNFMRDVCYDGAADMKAALEEGRPAGLHHLGNWKTIYEGLSILPQPANDSWFAFDHYYSDNAFPDALPLLFESNPGRILDIGGNTGKFARACMEYNPAVEMGLVDLQVQLNVATKNLAEAGFEGRFKTYAINMLDDKTELPPAYDIMWMSQFLSCFSDDEILSILNKCYRALPAEGSVFINETFWNEQQYEAAAMSLQMTSLYFTIMANGNSQMYDSQVFEGLIARAGFELAAVHRNIGIGHTILQLRKKL